MGSNNEECLLCRLARGLDRVTEVLHEDNTVISCFCKSHPNQILIVLKRHTAYPTQEELGHMKKIALKLFPEMHFRDSSSGSIRDHFHLHSI